jgi:hypothetical protein
MSIDHTEKGPGPKSTHARQRDEKAGLAEAGASSDPEKEAESDMAAPNAHAIGIDSSANAAGAVDTPTATEGR